VTFLSAARKHLSSQGGPPASIAISHTRRAIFFPPHSVPESGRGLHPMHRSSLPLERCYRSRQLHEITIPDHRTSHFAAFLRWAENLNVGLLVRFLPLEIVKSRVLQ
jgi:hypothetical protein